MATLYETLGFKVENGQVQTFETRKNTFDKDVPAGVRPATREEKLMWDLLERRF